MLVGQADNPCHGFLTMQDDTYTDSYISTIGVDFVSAGLLSPPHA